MEAREKKQILIKKCATFTESFPLIKIAQVISFGVHPRSVLFFRSTSASQLSLEKARAGARISASFFFSPDRDLTCLSTSRIHCPTTENWTTTASIHNLPNHEGREEGDGRWTITVRARERLTLITAESNKKK